MTSDHSIRSARLCAIVSAVLLVSVICVGGYRSASEKPTDVSAVAAPGNEIAVFAVDRNTIRQEELAQLQAIAEDETASEAIRASAQTRIMTLRQWMEQEASIADVLSARGYETPVVTVHSDSVNVVVRAESLTREEAGVIIELVTRETGVTGGNVKIIPIN